MKALSGTGTTVTFDLANATDRAQLSVSGRTLTINPSNALIDATEYALNISAGAITDAQGLVETSRMAAAFGHEGESPELPHWVRAWIAAEAARPWPPMQDNGPDARIAA